APLLRALSSLEELLAKSQPAAPADAAHPAPFAEAGETVRVELEALDDLMQGLGDLASRLEALRQRLRSTRECHRALQRVERALSARGVDGAGELEGIGQRLDALASDAQSAVGAGTRELRRVVDALNALRLVPAGAITSALERAARDVARAQGKRLRFSVNGGETRLDAPSLLPLRDALLHVVRNAVAHGVEPPEEREAAGKPVEGRVELEFRTRGDHVEIVCRDDGRGIDVARVGRAAVAQGRLSPEALAQLSEAEQRELVFEGGMTTAQGVSTSAGRGVGLDVVRDTVRRLSGSIALETEPGQGTSLTLTVPASLSSMSALAVRAAGFHFHLPVASVERTPVLRREDLVQV
ncbi:MAG: ATP-binding protein, partial [Myxococcales bacterium]